MKTSRNNQRKKRARRVRARISGSATLPRLTVFRSLTTMTAQIIDDTTGTTLVGARLGHAKGAKNTQEGAGTFGTYIAEQAKKAKIENVVFDRAGYKYHGKVKAFAEAARKGGLKF